MADVDCLTLPGLHYTMHLQTVTTSVCLPWWALGRASMSWTREDVAPYTTLLLLTRMESKSCSLKCNYDQYERTIMPESCTVFVRCVEYLLRNDADPGVRDKQGYSAVHYASAYGRTLCLELVCTAPTLRENVVHVQNLLS